MLKTQEKCVSVLAIATLGAFAYPAAAESLPDASFPALEPIQSQLDQEIQAEADHLEQVTSVAQLSDVNPSDWAFQALQSLVERYGN